LNLLAASQAEIADRMTPWPSGAALPNVHLGTAHISPVRRTAAARRLAARMAGKPIFAKKAEPIARRSLNWQI